MNGSAVAGIPSVMATGSGGPFGDLLGHLVFEVHPEHQTRLRLQRWQDAARGHIRLVTVAPEWPQAPAYIEALTSAGVVISIGHDPESVHVTDDDIGTLTD